MSEMSSERRKVDENEISQKLALRPLIKRQRRKRRKAKKTSYTVKPAKVRKVKTAKKVKKERRPLPKLPFSFQQFLRVAVAAAIGVGLTMWSFEIDWTFYYYRDEILFAPFVFHAGATVLSGAFGAVIGHLRKGQGRLGAVTGAAFWLVCIIGLSALGLVSFAAGT